LHTLILASSSPRRRELLLEMGLKFDVIPADIDESAIPADHPRTLAIRLAYAKACSVQATAPPESVILAADTVVALDGILYGKPSNSAEAADMLRSLSGCTHEVITGVALAMPESPEIHLHSECTRVRFRSLENAEIDQYIATREPFDKAGGYGIQGRGGELVESIEGDYFNVVGLPCALVASLLQEHTDLEVARIPHPPHRWVGVPKGHT